METRDPAAPWGTTRMAPYAETDPVPLRTPVIDPETQIAVVIDEHGRTVELYDHRRTSSSTSNSTSTSTADSYDSDDSSDSDHD